MAIIPQQYSISKNQALTLPSIEQESIIKLLQSSEENAQITVLTVSIFLQIFLQFYLLVIQVQWICHESYLGYNERSLIHNISKYDFNSDSGHSCSYLISIEHHYLHGFTDD
ncbi:hypothetical protein FGO68_gene7014 [Halteria grandinella]|uniref:Uncharacterized protein n=1 Tax=Halteria grandinella TaxID=5974 RepID=A0A8J8T9U6_HALGN|nr:hypothetical protein FGO68_gene7014 [Halteria grandinella]